MVGACIENGGRGEMSFASVLSQVMILQLMERLQALHSREGHLFACSNLSLFRMGIRFLRNVCDMQLVIHGCLSVIGICH